MFSRKDSFWKVQNCDLFYDMFVITMMTLKKLSEDYDVDVNDGDDVDSGVDDNFGVEYDNDVSCVDCNDSTTVILEFMMMTLVVLKCLRWLLWQILWRRWLWCWR